jgi:O-antigen/teichoic acid export membrane protein
LKIKNYESFFDTEQLKADMKRQTIQGGMITFTGQGIGFFLVVTSTVILARLLTPEHFGLIGMVTALTVLLERFQDIGLGDAIIQRKEINHNQVSTLFWITLSICLFLTVLVVFSAKAVAWFYDDHRLIWITIILSMNFVFSGLSIQHHALIRRRMRFMQQTLITIFSVSFGLAVGITFAWLGYGYWALVLKELSRSLLDSVLAWSFCSWRPGLPVRNAGIRSMLKFGGNITGYNMLFYLTSNLDSILLGKFFGAVSLGFYSRAKQLTAIPIGQLIEPMKNVALPALSALQGDPVTYRKYYLKILAVITFLYMPLIVYIGIYAHPIVYIALGSQWMDAVPIFRLLAISLFASPIVTMYGLIMLSSGQGRRYLLWGLFTYSSIIFFFIVGIKWGTLGIAASLSISTTVNLIFSLFFVFKGSPVSMTSTLKDIYRPAIASIIMGISLYLTYEFISSFHLVIQMAISFLQGGVVYLIIWMLFPGGYKDITEFVSYPLSILKRKIESRPN